MRRHLVSPCSKILRHLGDRPLIHDTSSIEQYDAANSGRQAWLLLQRTYMGLNTQQLLMATAENTLHNIKYTGQSRNFPFDKFVDRLRRAFNDLGPDDQPSEARKVRKLLDAFQVPSKEHLKSIITNDDHKSTNFEAAVTYLANELKPASRDAETRQVGALSNTQAKNNKPPGRSSNNPKKPKQDDKPTKWEGVGKSYPNKVWENVLTEEQRQQCRDHSAKLREQKAGRKRGAKSLSRKAKISKATTTPAAPSLDTTLATPQLQALCARSVATTQRSTTKSVRVDETQNQTQLIPALLPRAPRK